MMGVWKRYIYIPPFEKRQFVGIKLLGFWGVFLSNFEICNPGTIWGLASLERIHIESKVFWRIKQVGILHFLPKHFTKRIMKIKKGTWTKQWWLFSPLLPEFRPTGQPQHLSRKCHLFLLGRFSFFFKGNDLCFFLPIPKHSHNAWKTNSHTSDNFAPVSLHTMVEKQTKNPPRIKRSKIWMGLGPMTSSHTSF